MPNSKPLLVLIEDDEILGRSLQQRFSLEGYRVKWARSASEAAIAIRDVSTRFVLSDIRLPDGSGEDVVRQAFSERGAIPTLFMTAYGDIEQAVRLIKLGARDYIAKPFDLDALIERVGEILAPSLDPNVDDPFACFGVSPSTAKIRQVLDKLATSDLPVLLTGETGTGKEIGARYLHAAHPDSNRPFVAINCAAVPGDLFESFLFGHEKGAFTGASARQTGYLEQAGSGTLFFDEVGELDINQQAKLLRVLETKTFHRVGDSKEIQCKARFVFATNKDLEAAVANGQFRSDLLFRINVVDCRMPPLRERPSEVVMLMEHHIQRIAERRGEQPPRISDEAIAFAPKFSWPGNIRELVNRVERGIALKDGACLELSDLWPEQAQHSITRTVDLTLADAREHAEKDAIEQALLRNGGNISETAKALGVSRTTLWSKIQRYRIKASD
ncbi:sigma-54-dependent transcriptional regulator [Pseudomonas aeruginosa]